MTNPFRDQEKFMRACDQSVDAMNESQYTMYKSLIEEEFRELQEAHDMEAELDALIDILVVTIGAIHSAGFDGEAAWNGRAEPCLTAHSAPHTISMAGISTDHQTIS